MKDRFSFLRYFSAAEYALWGGSVVLIIGAFLLFDRVEYLTPATALLGVTSLIFNAKGHPVGQAMMVVFSVLYGIISYSYAYYGEMITYLGMTMPMALYALFSWLRHPYRGRRTEVTVSRLSGREYGLMAVLTVAVTLLFFFVLRAFETAYLPLSTLSVTTSFAAVYLTARRSPLYAIAYALNDLVLVALWVLAAQTDAGYVSVVVCFGVFFVNDVYGFISWRKMAKRQQESSLS